MAMAMGMAVGHIVHACGVMDHGHAYGLTAPAAGLRTASTALECAAIYAMRRNLKVLHVFGLPPPAAVPFQYATFVIGFHAVVKSVCAISSTEYSIWGYALCRRPP